MSDPPCKEYNARFTTVPLKPLCITVCTTNSTQSTLDIAAEFKQVLICLHTHYRLNEHTKVLRVLLYIGHCPLYMESTVKYYDYSPLNLDRHPILLERIFKFLLLNVPRSSCRGFWTLFMCSRFLWSTSTWSWIHPALSRTWRFV